MKAETNGDLFEYGIHNEGSDIRAHVSVVHKTIYVFRTVNGVQAIDQHKQQLRTGFAFQAGVEGPTAEGWLMPIDWILDLRPLRFHTWEGWLFFDKKMSTSAKGKFAVSCVLKAIELGRFPFWIKTTEDDRKNVQIKGTDVLLFCRQRIQIKCDFEAGPRPEGTGHLFLQKSERNPLKRH